MFTFFYISYIVT